MKYIWAGERTQINTNLIFYITLNKPCDILKIGAVDSYRIFGDGKFIAYGPDRTAAEYIRPKTLDVSGVKNLEIYVSGYNKSCFGCDFQQPFFGAELYKGDDIVYDSENFSVKTYGQRLRKVQRYSPQRGFTEVYDFIDGKCAELQSYLVPSPKEIDEIKIKCNYDTIDLIEYGGCKNFVQFDACVRECYWYNSNKYKLSDDYYNESRDFIDKIKNGGYSCKDFSLPVEKTGFIGLDIVAEEDVEIFCVFDEFVGDKGWIFHRSNCNDFIRLLVPKGKFNFLSAEPYAFKYLKIISNAPITIKVKVVLLENSNADKVLVFGNEKISAVFEAARNTFKQNALDIYMDCPGRERAGWLCDSYFTAMAEELFTGKREIERCFIENFLLAKTPEIADGMIPKSFPSQHDNGEYVPNWSMFFVLELESYLKSTGDFELIQCAKEKIYKLIAFFDKYVNEFGLLEDLESWVFIEWSICNNKDYIKGVNFPSNMLFARMLDSVYYMYGDKTCHKRAKEIRKTIKELSYNGKFFVDNAVRVDGELVSCQDHISETNQYYALFLGMQCDKEFKQRIKTEFGPKRIDKYPEIGKSNMFIGYYLRLFWLLKEGDNDKVIEESLDYFYEMSQKTGTLWEHYSPTASCNHGFASVAAVILLCALVGYKGVKNGTPIIEKTTNEDFSVCVAFNY